MAAGDWWRVVAAGVVGGALLAVLASCHTLGGPAGEPPASAACEPDESLTGVWKDFRMSQLGPAWVRLVLRCDCTYGMRIQLLWMRVRESGVYRVDGEELVFEREAGETRWPFEVGGGRLSLEEYPGEVMDHRLASDLVCRAGTRPPGRSPEDVMTRTPPAPAESSSVPPFGVSHSRSV